MADQSVTQDAAACSWNAGHNLATKPQVTTKVLVSQQD